MTLLQALTLMLAHVDYTTDQCSAHAQVGAALPRAVLDAVRHAIAEQSGLATYRIGHDEMYIECRKCGVRSYDSSDIRHRYCRKCQDFHSDHTPVTYRDMAAHVRASTHADGVVLLALGGDQGNGFSIDGPIDVLKLLPDLLRTVLEDLEKERP